MIKSELYECYANEDIFRVYFWLLSNLTKVQSIVYKITDVYITHF